MKAIKLTVKNIGIVADATIEFNKPLICLYGEICAGKTTLLNCVKWVFGGSFPTDIIRTGETEAEIRFTLDDGEIIRSFYVSQKGETKSRPIQFFRLGAPVPDPVAEIKKFLNPFLLDQNFLIEKSEPERKKFFASLFAVDTDGLDAEISGCERAASDRRQKLKGYGEIDVTVVEPPDIESLKSVRQAIVTLLGSRKAEIASDLANRRADYQAKLRNTEESNAAIRKHNYRVNETVAAVKQLHTEINDLTSHIAALRVKLADANSRFESNQAWLKDNDIQPELPPPAAPDFSALEASLCGVPDTTEVDCKLQAAGAQQVRYENYLANLRRAKEREVDEAEILHLDATTRELRAKKIAKLKTASDNTGIPGLSFDEAGNFSYEGTTAGMLSTSQLMRLSSALSALYPPGFGIELLDRGESLGRSIFGFVDRAKSEKKTILATIVGERPAVIPADVGVFVVEAGTLK